MKRLILVAMNIMPGILDIDSLHLRDQTTQHINLLISADCSQRDIGLQKQHRAELPA